MGTVNNDLLPIYQSCIDALKKTNYQVVLSIGNQVNPKLIKNKSENISIYPSVDQIAVLQQSDLFITHCGMNSVTEALFFGVPLLMLPQTSEQVGVSRRVEQLGAGIIQKRMNAKAIYKSVETLLCSQEYYKNASKISESFQKCSGAQGAAKKILDVCDL